MIDEYICRADLRAHLDIYWLRPESALWDAIAAKHIAGQLEGRKDILEVGIGNGFFSFLMLGGRFRPEFDWFMSASTEGYWQNADIYDHDSGVAIDSFVIKQPHTRIRYGLDHKQNLLNQAARIGFVDEIIQHDCNCPLPQLPCSTAYSNMLYWLADPLSVMDRIGDLLPKGGELITVFPNSDFYRNCESYRSTTPLWRLINRGRADHIMWHMDLPDFEAEIRRRGVFDMSYSTKYLSPLTLNIWDIGLRPLSVPLIRMADALPPAKRAEIKAEWCDTLEQFCRHLLDMEAEEGSTKGGYNLVRLTKR